MRSACSIEERMLALAVGIGGAVCARHKPGVASCANYYAMAAMAVTAMLSRLLRPVLGEAVVFTWPRPTPPSSAGSHQGRALAWPHPGMTL
jgi:hypothetical protein